MYAILLACNLAASEGFAPSTGHSRDAPFFVNIMEKPSLERTASQPPIANKLEMEKPTKEKKTPVKEASLGHGNKGPFAPVVVLAKNILGEEQLNQIRGKAIAEHSKVIGGFVDTSKTPFGERALRTLFYLADADKNGKIEEHELAAAFRYLGFDHLKEKQIKGIFERADKDENGAIDFEEWCKEAPSTLRTNLIKLAKKNGGELGFLA